MVDSYLDEMSDVQRELLVLFSEAYSGSSDNFVEALEYAEREHPTDFDESEFDTFEEFDIPMKNYWREFGWEWVVASFHTAPNVDEPAVSREDGVEQEVLESMQYWSAEVRNSFYSHMPSWVAGDTGVDEGVVHRVMEKVQGELFAFEPPSELYYVGLVDEDTVRTGGDIGRLVFPTFERAIEQAEYFDTSTESGKYSFRVFKIEPGDETLVAPFYERERVVDDERYVLAYLGDAEVSVEADNVLSE